MEKLELKHLAPYLPYGLNWDISETGYAKVEKDRLKECKLVSLAATELITSICLKTNIETQNNGLLFVSKETGKPILRPLSDLTKEIITDETIEFGKSLFAQSYYNSSLDFENAIFNEEIPLSVYNLLLKYHFDVLGLIPKGLAISYNDIR